MHDIYDPPPAPIHDFNPPKPDGVKLTRDDFLCLIGLCTLLTAVSFTAWRTEPALAVGTALAGSLVIMESWFTAVGFVHRAAPLRLRARWTVFLAALVPWLIGLGVAVSVMLSLFWVFDRVG